MSLSHGTGPREEPPRRTRSKHMTLTGLIIFLLIGAVAGWLAGVIIKGVGFGLVGNIVVGVIGSLIGGWLFGLLGIAADGLIGSIIAALVCDHPPRHRRADQASVAPSLLVGGRAGTCAFLPRRVLHARTDEEKPTKPAACCVSTSQPGPSGPSSSTRPRHSVAPFCAQRRRNSSASGGQ